MSKTVETTFIKSQILPSFVLNMVRVELPTQTYWELRTMNDKRQVGYLSKCKTRSSIERAWRREVAATEPVQ
jgi:hypothetical protein